MSSTKDKPNFEVKGRTFTTEPIHRTDDNVVEPVRVVWDGGNSWSLRLLAEGQSSLRLPGDDSCLRREDIRSMAERNRVIIVTGGWSSGLSSFHNWLVGDSQMISLDLDWVSRSEESRAGRIRRAAERIRKEIGLWFPPESQGTTDEASESKRLLAAIQDNEDPIDILETIAREYNVDGVVFRNFDALDEETKRGLFGRLRRLYDDEDRPMCNLPVFLLGHSYWALDPMMAEPGSNLLPFSYLYTLPNRSQDEIKEMAKKLDSWEERLAGKELDRLISWSGGQPFLVQTLLSLMESRGARFSLAEAIAVLESERVPALEVWVRKLTSFLNNDTEVERIIHILLRQNRFPRRLARSRFAVEELFIQGWINLDSSSDQEDIIWFSECHRMLAGEAYALRTRQ